MKLDFLIWLALGSVALSQGVGGAASPAVPPRQVLIEATILEVPRDGSRPLDFALGETKWFVEASSADARGGADARLGSSPGNGGAGLNASEYVSASGAGYEALLGRLSRERGVKILQRPRIQACDAVAATIFVGEAQPIAGTPGPIRTGVTFEVIPRLKGEGAVEMDMRVRVDALEGSVTIGEVPVTSSREATARLVVRDREAVLLGGFVAADKKEAVSYARFPKELPVPGALFSRKAAKPTGRELLVLVRPTLLASGG
jgi:type II secretory pathway component GspD/PulD (secretin)